MWSGDAFSTREKHPSRSGSLVQLVPLKTTLETRKRDAVVEVYVATVPAKEANGILRYVKLFSVFCTLGFDLFSAVT